MRLLLINPNSSTHITDRMVASARTTLVQGDVLTAVTAIDGPAVVRSAELLAQADASAMALADAHASQHDAIVLGISLDGAAPRLRQHHPELPIVGMTEAGLLSACLQSERIGLLTLGASVIPLYRQRVEQIGLASRVVAYQAPESVLAFAAETPLVDAAVLDVLADASERLRQDGAQSIVMAGAVLCGYAKALAARCEMPVFDGVACAVGHVRILLARM
ncbi:MAG: aspartate/glutamate racemase family protein [Rubrivivax sp.]